MPAHGLYRSLLAITFSEAAQVAINYLYQFYAIYKVVTASFKATRHQKTVAPSNDWPSGRE